MNAAKTDPLCTALWNLEDTGNDVGLMRTNETSPRCTVDYNFPFSNYPSFHPSNTTNVSCEGLTADADPYKGVMPMCGNELRQIEGSYSSTMTTDSGLSDQLSMYPKQCGGIYSANGDGFGQPFHSQYNQSLHSDDISRASLNVVDGCSAHSLNSTSPQNANLFELTADDVNQIIRDTNPPMSTSTTRCSSGFGRQSIFKWNSKKKRSIAELLSTIEQCAQAESQPKTDFSDGSVSWDAPDEHVKSPPPEFPFTYQELELMQQCFAETAYPDGATKQDLAKALNVKVELIEEWFSHRRFVVGLGMKKKVRGRHVPITDEQIKFLEEKFSQNALQRAHLREIGKSVGLSTTTVRKWVTERQSREFGYTATGGTTNSPPPSVHKLTATQVAKLRIFFTTDPDPDLRTREQIAIKIGSNEPIVNRWFFKGRHRERLSVHARLKKLTSEQSGSDPEYGCFNRKQRKTLAEKYKTIKNPDWKLIEEIAKEIGEPVPLKVLVWFDDQRAKEMAE